MVSRYYAGIDLGTSSVKVVIIDEEGNIVGNGSRNYSIDHLFPQYAEQRPERWWSATIAALQLALNAVDDRSRLRAIGLSGQMHGTVLLDKHAKCLTPAVIWADQRAYPQVQKLQSRLSQRELIQIAGGPPSTGFQGLTIRWFSDNQPALLEHVAHVLLPKDYIRWRLTDFMNTDPSDASGTYLFDVHRRIWSDILIEQAAIYKEKLPTVLPSQSVVGMLKTEVAQSLGLSKDIRIVNGAADTASSMLCAGTLDSDTLLMTISTGGQLVLPLTQFSIDRQGRVHTFCSAFEPSSQTPGWYMLGGTLAAGLALRWLKDRVFNIRSSQRFNNLCLEAESIPTSASDIVFLPYLLGERSITSTLHTGGVFFGLSSQHGQSELIRAVMEGVAMACYESYEVFQELGAVPQRLIISGGGANFPLWRHIFADMFGLPTFWLDVTEQSAFGAAMLARGETRQGELTEIIQKRVTYRDVIHPNMNNHAAYRERLLAFPKLRKSLTPE